MGSPSPARRSRRRSGAPSCRRRSESRTPSTSRSRRCCRRGTASPAGSTRSAATTQRRATTTATRRRRRPRRRRRRRRARRHHRPHRRRLLRQSRCRRRRRRPHRRRRLHRHRLHPRLARTRNAAVLGAGVRPLAGVGVCIFSAWPADSPLVPRNGGLLEGDTTWAWIYLAGEIFAFAAYVVGLLLLRRNGVRLAAVATLAAAIQLAPLGAPLLISSDAWTYWDYARIAVVHDANPYTDTPSQFPNDPAYPYIGGAWHGSTSVYGPLFTLGSEPVAVAAGSSANRAAWLFKSLAALAILGTVALATF